MTDREESLLKLSLYFSPLGNVVMLKLLPHFPSLGVHLKRARKDRRLTQAYLAQQAQLSIDTLRLLENGSGNLTSLWAVLSTLNLAIVGSNLPPR